jgi:hypothetical protein
VKRVMERARKHSATSFVAAGDCIQSKMCAGVIGVGSLMKELGIQIGEEVKVRVQSRSPVYANLLLTMQCTALARTTFWLMDIIYS